MPLPVNGAQGNGLPEEGNAMVGITLSPEQIRAAPPEVRRWLEHEIAVSLGLQAPEAAEAKRRSPHLVSLSVDEAAKVLTLIEGTLPVANVFFELGREGSSAGVDGLEAFRLTDILRHARLQTLEQLAACLEAINAAVRSVRADEGATLYGMDQQGYCFIADETQRSILRVWQQLVMERGLMMPGPAPKQTTPRPVPIAATAPASPAAANRQAAG
jgi:hypothetical protein